ncbi:unnamed protein product, partial [Candidula unifasciata]
LFTMDIISTGSSNEDEAASKTITDIIHGLDSNSEYGSQTSADKEGTTVLASGKSENDSHMLKNSVPETQRTASLPSCLSSNGNFQTSQCSNEVNGLLDKRAARLSRRSCVYKTSNSSMSLDQNASDGSKSRSANKSENKSRRSEPPRGPYSRDRQTSLNALSPKDLNIDTPPLTVKSLGLEALYHQEKTGTVKISGNADGSVRSGRRLLEAVSEVGNNNCEKVATAASDDNMESNVASIRAQVGQQRTKRLSKRQSLISEMSESPSLISIELKQPSLITQENAKVGLSLGFESEKLCKSTKESLLESNKQNKKATYSNSGMLRGSADSAASESSTALKVARKKRNLLAGAAFPVSSLEAPAKQKSPVTKSSHKSKLHIVGSDIKSDISFMFGFKSHGTKTENKKIKRRSTRLNRELPESSVDGLSGSEQSVINSSSKNVSAVNDSLCKTATENTSVSSHGKQNQSSFGDSMLKGEMSMSMAYGHDDSSANITRVGTSRRSLEEFRTNIKTTGRNRKPGSLSTLRSTAAKTSNDSTKTDELKNKLTKTNVNTQQTKRIKRSLSPSGSTTSGASEKHKRCDQLPGADVDSTLSESSLAEDDQVPARLRHAHSLLMEQKRQPPSKRSACTLVVTSLHRDEQETVYAIVKSLGVFHLTNNVEPTTTHVVCGESRRTLNLLKGIASGCWLLRKEWVLESLEAGTWLQEESYEMRDILAAVKSRSERQKVGPSYKANLFSKCGPIFVSSACTPPRKEVVHLINLCCGQVTGSETRAAIHLGDDHNPRKLVIKPVWVLDCIMKLETLPTDDYIVFPKALTSHRESSPEF